jgi:acyl carrier protein
VAERWAQASPTTQRFWSDYLQGADVARLPRLAGVPADDRWAQAAGQEVKRHSLRLSSPLVVALARQADALGVPLKSVMLAIHGLSQGLLCHRTRVMVGMVANGRLERGGGDTSVGLYLNSLPMRIDLAVGRWDRLVRQVFQEEARLLPHRRFPLADMGRVAGIGGPLFETLFNYLDFQSYASLADVAGMRLRGAQVEEQTRFPLTVTSYRDPVERSVELVFTYRPEMIAGELVEELGRVMLRASQAFAGDPAASLQETDFADSGRRPLSLPAPTAAASQVAGGLLVTHAAAEELEVLREERWAGHDGGAAGRAGQPLEEEICAIWNSVLGRMVKEPAADFFESGGNSLALMKLVVGLRHRFSIEVSISDLFESTTIAAQGQLVAARLGSSQ